MYRIRFHGRGGQGMKTAGRVLGTAFFLSGFEVQDAPRYGAERRGAPIFAFVRAARAPIDERGVILRPGLVIVADDSLPAVPAAGVLQGLDADAVLLINTHETAETWRRRLNLAGPIVVLPAAEPVAGGSIPPSVGSACAGAAARLVGVVDRESLATAVRTELAALPEQVIEDNVARALAAFESVAEHAGRVQEGAQASARDYARPQWIDLEADSAWRSAPAIHVALTSVQVRTGLWRTLRPVIDPTRCNRCWWVCSTLCPDGAIGVTGDGRPEIDYDHCKGCLVCMAVCPPHAIEAVPEHAARQETSP
jgi:pyruvate ferredoxin oxidoreductase gamma subunit